MNNTPAKYDRWAKDFKENNLAGILLESVGSWVDANGVHPLLDNGVPDLDKDMTVPYDEIEFIEFTDLMSRKDATLYRVALKEYDRGNSKQSKAWAL
jgi:hypothetical protein